MNFISKCLLMGALLSSSLCQITYGSESEKPALAQKSDKVLELEFVAGADNHAALIDEAIKGPLKLASVSFQSDSYISAAEFSYLTDFQKGQSLSPEQIKQAVKYLFLKNKFEKISIRIVGDAAQANLHVELKSQWTFKKLKLHGILIGKDVYRQYYGMEAGDLFDEERHKQSVEKIEEAFKADGYFASVIKSSFTREEYTKQVTVHLDLKKGNRFSISGVDLAIEKEGVMLSADDSFIKEIDQEFGSKLRGSYYDKQLINKEAKNLKRFLEKKGYVDVSASMQQLVDSQAASIHLKFEINLNHKRAFIFQGNKFFTQDQLFENVLLFGRSAWHLPASILSEEIEALYKAHGFWLVKIESHEETDRYIFTIIEGERATIKKVAIRNLKIKEEELLTKQFFAKILKSKEYNEESIAHAIDDLKQWYAKEGFLNFKITKQEFLPLDHGNNILEITVDEGRSSSFGQVKIEPYKELESEGPFAQFQDAKDLIPFDPHMLYEQRRWLLNYFHLQGYAYVDAKPEMNHENGKVFVLWHITTSGESKIRFGKTVLVGSSRLPFEYIKREFAHHQNDIWNKEVLKQSFIKLKDLEIFENINFLPYRATEPEEEKDVLLRLQPDDPYEFRLRAGLEFQNFVQQYAWEGITYRLGGAFLLKSPFNIADQFRVDANFTRVHREFMAKYTMPWLYKLPIKTIIMGYSNQYAQPGFIGNPDTLYNVTQQGFLVGFSRKVWRIDAGLNLGFEWIKTKIPDQNLAMVTLFNNAARAIDFEPRLLDRSMPFFQVEPTVIIDYLDYKLNPRKGFFTLFSLKGMFPMKLADINTYLVKALVDQSFFTPIKSCVLGLRLRLGHIFNRKFSAIMPIERFYLGGANSLRGYDTDFAPPIGRFFDCNGVERFAPQGGKTMFNANLELRFPLYKMLSGVAFQDFGALSSNSFADFEAKNLLASTGFGLRLATPVGPLRFDIGWKWRKIVPEERSFAWFLTFGQAF